MQGCLCGLKVRTEQWLPLCALMRRAFGIIIIVFVIIIIIIMGAFPVAWPFSSC